MRNVPLCVSFQQTHLINSSPSSCSCRWQLTPWGALFGQYVGVCRLTRTSCLAPLRQTAVPTSQIKSASPTAKATVMRKQCPSLCFLLVELELRAAFFLLLRRSTPLPMESNSAPDFWQGSCKRNDLLWGKYYQAMDSTLSCELTGFVLIQFLFQVWYLRKPGKQEEYPADHDQQRYKQGSNSPNRNATTRNHISCIHFLGPFPYHSCSLITLIKRIQNVGSTTTVLEGALRNTDCKIHYQEAYGRNCPKASHNPTASPNDSFHFWTTW